MTGINALLRLLLIPHVFAFQYLKADALPAENLSAGCVAALTAEISCPRAVRAFIYADYLPTATLDEACTAECASGLSTYRSAVARECVGRTYLDESLISRPELPINYLAVVLQHHFNSTCLADTGRWCNNVALQAVGGDPSVGRLPKSSSPPCFPIVLIQRRLTQVKTTSQPDNRDSEPMR